MKRTNENGLTLVTLIAIVIGVLIVASIAIDAVIGEEGTIARAKEAKFMADFSDILVKIENDIIDVKKENAGKKLSIVDIFYNLTHKYPESYEIRSAASVYGSVLFDVWKLDSSISNLRVKFNGDI